MSPVGVLAADILEVVVVYRLFEGFDARLVAELHDVTVVNVDIKTPLLGELVEPVIEVFSMSNILFEAEDGPLPEVNGLVDDGAEDLGVVKRSCCWLRRWLPWLRLVLIGSAGWLVDLRSLENPGFDGVWLEVDLKVPLLDFFGV